MGSRLSLMALAAAVCTPAWAADPASPVGPLPLFAAAPPPPSLDPATAGLATAAAGQSVDPRGSESIYHGLYVGTDLYGVGGHGIKGGFGGDVYAGYERRLDGGAIVAMQGATGYGPALLGRPGVKGFDFGQASALVAYPMGRLTPFLTADLLVARPVTGAGLATSTTDGFNDLMNGPGNLYAAPRVGAGFAYALTGNTSVQFDVSVGRGPLAAWP